MIDRNTVDEIGPSCRLVIGNSTERHFTVFQPPDGGVYVDVGAYTGEIAARAASLAKDLTLLLVEPNPKMPQEIAKNMKGQKFIVFPMAAGHVDNAPCYLYSYTGAGWGGSLNINHPIRTLHNYPITASYLTVVARLDTMLEKAKVDTVDFVKIDTEGFESQVLQGLTKYHSGTKFHIEYHWNFIDIMFQLQKMKIMPVEIELWTEFNGETGAIHAEAK